MVARYENFTLLNSVISKSQSGFSGLFRGKKSYITSVMVVISDGCWYENFTLLNSVISKSQSGFSGLFRGKKSYITSVMVVISDGC